MKEKAKRAYMHLLRNAKPDSVVGGEYLMFSEGLTEVDNLHSVIKAKLLDYRIKRLNLQETTLTLLDQGRWLMDYIWNKDDLIYYLEELGYGYAIERNNNLRKEQGKGGITYYPKNYKISGREYFEALQACSLSFRFWKFRDL